MYYRTHSHVLQNSFSRCVLGAFDGCGEYLKRVCFVGCGECHSLKKIRLWVWTPRKDPNPSTLEWRMLQKRLSVLNTYSDIHMYTSHLNVYIYTAHEHHTSYTHWLAIESHRFVCVECVISHPRILDTHTFYQREKHVPTKNTRQSFSREYKSNKRVYAGSGSKNPPAQNLLHGVPYAPCDMGSYKLAMPLIPMYAITQSHV